MQPEIQTTTTKDQATNYQLSDHPSGSRSVTPIFVDKTESQDEMDFQELYEKVKQEIESLPYRSRFTAKYTWAGEQEIKKFKETFPDKLMQRAKEFKNIGLSLENCLQQDISVLRIFFPTFHDFCQFCIKRSDAIFIDNNDQIELLQKLNYDYENPESTFEDVKSLLVNRGVMTVPHLQRLVETIPGINAILLNPTYIITLLQEVHTYQAAMPEQLQKPAIYQAYLLDVLEVLTSSFDPEIQLSIIKSIAPTFERFVEIFKVFAKGYSRSVPGYSHYYNSEYWDRLVPDSRRYFIYDFLNFFKTTIGHQHLIVLINEAAQNDQLSKLVGEIEKTPFYSYFFEVISTPIRATIEEELIDEEWIEEKLESKQSAPVFLPITQLSAPALNTLVIDAECLQTIIVNITLYYKSTAVSDIQKIMSKLTLKHLQFIYQNQPNHFINLISQLTKRLPLGLKPLFQLFPTVKQGTSDLPFTFADQLFLKYVNQSQNHETLKKMLSSIDDDYLLHLFTNSMELLSSSCLDKVSLRRRLFTLITKNPLTSQQKPAVFQLIPATWDYWLFTSHADIDQPADFLTLLATQELLPTLFPNEAEMNDYLDWLKNRTIQDSALNLTLLSILANAYCQLLQEKNLLIKSKVSKDSNKPDSSESKTTMSSLLSWFTTTTQPKSEKPQEAKIKQSQNRSGLLTKQTVTGSAKEIKDVGALSLVLTTFKQQRNFKFTQEDFDSALTTHGLKLESLTGMAQKIYQATVHITQSQVKEEPPLTASLVSVLSS